MVSCGGVRVSPAGIPRGCVWTLRAPACRVCACAAGTAVSRGDVLVARGCGGARVGGGRWRAFFVVWRLGGQKSFRTTRICDQNFRASPPVGWRGSEAGRAGLWGECKGGAGARLQTHNRGDSHGRSQAGGRFRHLAACRGRRQALWEIVRSILPEGPGKALRALPAAFWCRLPWPLC